MSEPHTADLGTRYRYRQEGAQIERERIVERIQAIICFDALADEDGRCIHHRGKCYEIGQLANELMKGTK